MPIKAKYGGYSPSYYVQPHGNDIQIIGLMPEELTNKVMMMPDDYRTQTLPVTYGATYKLKNTIFYFFYDEQKKKAFVRFDLHKFSDDTRAIKVLIQLAAEHLYMLKFNEVN